MLGFIISGLLFVAAAYGIYKLAQHRGALSDTPVETPTRPGVPGKAPEPK